MKRIFALILMAGSMLGSSNAELLTLRIGTEGTYRPWTMVDASGKVYGFEADMAQAICDKLKAKCEFVVGDFNGLITSLQAKRYDIIMTSLSISEDRKKQISFSIPYASLPNSFVTHKNSELLKIKDSSSLIFALAGKKVGVLSAATQANYLQHFIPAAKMIPYDHLDQMEMDLVAGRLDAGFSDVSAWADFLKRPEAADFRELSVKILNEEAPEFLGEGIAVGLPLDANDLREKINQAILLLKEEGIIKKISEKWLKIDGTLH